MKTGKKLFAAVLTVSMILPASVSLAADRDSRAALPEPYYAFTFEGNVDGGKVASEGSKAGAEAVIGGSGQGLGVVYDSELESKVLNLPGGGLGQGYLDLPDEMYGEVTDSGFAYSFWLNVDSNAGQYNRVFSSAPIAFNSDNGGTGWNAPEFTFVAGLEGAADMGDGQAGYNTSAMLSDRGTQMKLVWDRQPARGRWQYVTVSVSPSSYDVYLDGEKVGITYDRNNNMREVLAALFQDQAAELKTYTNNAIGRSVYTTDADLKAKVDDFRFYTTALTAEQAKAVYDSYEREIQEPVPTLRFDASGDTGDILHGSTGFLYGVSEVNVPSMDLIQAIRPKILVQKAADGQQHPSGDGYRLSDYLHSAGVENVQIYLQDYYLEWPYESKGIDDYNKKVKSIVTKMLDGLTDEEVAGYSFVIFNEPDSIWYGGDISRMCEDWLKIYTTLKEIHPDVRVAGPNFAGFPESSFRTYFEFCARNNCLPDYVTWHELSKGSLTAFEGHLEFVQGLIDRYYKDSDIEPTIFINETVNFDDIGNPGALVNWISLFEEKKTCASLPYWGLANSLNELAADANKPNGAWWVYKWYAQMTGKTVPMTLQNVAAPGPYGRLYGLTSVDAENKTIHTLFGGQAGQQTIQIQKIKSTEIFKNVDSAHVKIYSTKYTGHQGFADEIPVEFEGNLAFTGDDLIFAVPDAELMDAYYAVITPATDDTVTTIADYEKEKWEQTYEAEDAQLLGNARAFTKTGGDLARSNRAEVGAMNQEGDGVRFEVDVPKDGVYRLNVYYSNQAPQVDPLTLKYVASGGQNRAIGAISTHTLSVDGKEIQDLNYDSTVKWGYYNYKTVYLQLAKGSHSIQLAYKGENQNPKEDNSKLCALLDKIDLTYEPDTAAKLVVEPEELAGLHDGFTFRQSAESTGAGYVEGSGDYIFYVNAPREGYYTVQTKGSGSAALSRGVMLYAKDAKAQSDVGIGWQKLLDVKLGSGSAGAVYLAAGMNRMKFGGDSLKLDQITFTEDTKLTEENRTVIEAEDAQLTGSGANDGYQYLPGQSKIPEVINNAYASGGKAVEGFRGGLDNQLAFKVQAPKEGNYRLSITYSNDESAPVMKTESGGNYVHPYNTDLVERYAQIAVNGGEPQTVYFRNTFCWDVWHDAVVDVTLKKGENTIVLSNDNSYKFSSVQDDFTPRFDQFRVAPCALAEEEPGVKVDEYFTDVTPADEKTQWPVPEIQDVFDRGIMSGYKDANGNPTHEFGTKAPLSRAHFALTLWRAEALENNGTAPEPEGEAISFGDISEMTQEIKDAVAWASSAGIVNGYKDEQGELTGSFGPSNPINRTEMSLMLKRYAKHKGYDGAQIPDDVLNGYKDLDQINPYDGGESREALKWAVANKIIIGEANSPFLEPEGVVDRARCATFLSRFLKNIAEK